MQTLREPNELPTWRSRARDAKEFMSDLVSGACCHVTEGFLLEWPVTSIILSIGVCLALAASGLPKINVSGSVFVCYRSQLLGSSVGQSEDVTC